jgi:hypothetical protein
LRVQPSNCPFSVIPFQIHERWASLDAEAIPLLLNGVALGVYSADMDAGQIEKGQTYKWFCNEIPWTTM